MSYKPVIILGGGKSVREGVALGLFEHIKNKEVWSLNYSYKLLPFLPTRQLFVDFNFFKNNTADIENLYKNGVPIHVKKHSRYNILGIEWLHQYNSVREQGGFRGKDALKEPPEVHLFVGRLGLVGTFSLSLAIAEGYDEIYLLGFDFGVPVNTDKDTHWYQNEIKVESTGVGKPLVYMQPNGQIKKQVEDFKVFTTVPDIRIYNISVNSNIEYFSKYTYEEFFKLLEDNEKNNS